MNKLKNPKTPKTAHPWLIRRGSHAVKGGLGAFSQPRAQGARQLPHLSGWKSRSNRGKLQTKRTDGGPCSHSLLSRLSTAQLGKSSLPLRSAKAAQTKDAVKPLRPGENNTGMPHAGHGKSLLNRLNQSAADPYLNWLPHFKPKSHAAPRLPTRFAKASCPGSRHSSWRCTVIQSRPAQERTLQSVALCRNTQNVGFLRMQNLWLARFSCFISTFAVAVCAARNDDIHVHSGFALRFSSQAAAPHQPICPAPTSKAPFAFDLQHSLSRHPFHRVPKVIHVQCQPLLKTCFLSMAHSLCCLA